MRKFLIFIWLTILLLIVAGCAAASPLEKQAVDMTSLIPQQQSKDIKSSTAAIPTPSNPEDELNSKAAAMLQSLTTDEKIGQLLVVGFPAGTESGTVQSYLTHYKVSGFILFKRNYPDFDALYRLNSQLMAWNAGNPLPLFLSVDEEGGTVSRLPQGGTKFPSARLIGNTGDHELTALSGRTIGKELKAGGVNMNFAPVLDVVAESKSFLYSRSYGSKPEVAAKHGGAFIEALQTEGVIAVPKHFPGHGGTATDSHGKLPVIHLDGKTFETRELAAFKAAGVSKMDAVMVGHLSFPDIDPSKLPASMSEYFLTEVLRNKLGFKGIAISDEIEMYGFTNGQKKLEENVITAFNAGLDVFVIGHTLKMQDRIFEALKKGVSEGRISEERLDEAVLRIIRVKLKYELSNEMPYPLEQAKLIFGSPENKKALELVKEAIRKKGN